MISAEEFLKKFKESQASASFQHELSITDSPELELDSTLTSALQRGWHIAHVLARSKYFSQRALAGAPTQNLAQVRLWAKQYRECGCNWVAETGAKSGLLTLEYTYDIGQNAIRDLCKDDWSWRETAQFTDRNARSVCFRYSGEQIRTLGNQFPGIRIHLGDCILVPPSVTTTSQVSYLNASARVMNLPNWLCAVRRVPTTAGNHPQVCG